MAKNSAQLLAVSRGAQSGTLDIHQVWDVDASTDFASDYTQIVSLAANGERKLFCYSLNDARIDVFQVKDGTSWMQRIASYAWPGHWDLVRSLTFGGASYLLLYQQKNGSLTICRIRADHTLEFVSEYSRTYGAKTTGFSTLGVYAHRGLVYVLGCSVDDGHAGIYQVIATEEIPATLTWQWNHQWAKGWTRFAFYNWGGENYFLKTNVAYKNVNIDHICDDASKGTHEVGSRLPLPLDLDFVEPLYVDHSPFFVADRVTGELTFHRFHASGQGWSKEGEFVAIPGIRLLAPLIASEGSHLLVYGDSS